MSVDFSFEDGKAIAEFLNSSAGRSQLMRQAEETIVFPIYSPGAWSLISVHD
ncbi:MAG: hypothetical protein OXE94_09215 [Aestuariivita sp.]|nr:hypothetical protein [Aestuariivita sp.]MCY4201796.1 hypothetical protein [Aestuariivita sp.]MCY4288477.1 hypothetical protein [Aestuariivita sp.]MCY4347061.1 hypothetical protein [Aestuariivita sp.]